MARVFTAFSPEQRTEAYENLKDKLIEFKVPVYALEPVFLFLSLLTIEQRTDALNKIKVIEPIADAKSFGKLLAAFTVEEYEALIQKIDEPKLVKLVFTTPGKEFDSSILTSLNTQQLIKVLDILQHKFPNLIPNVKVLSTILPNLTAEKCTGICTQNQTIANLVKNKKDFAILLEPLNPEQRIAICSAWKDRLAQLIPAKNIDKYLAYFPQDPEKSAFQELYLNSLCQNIMTLKGKLPVEADKKAVVVLHEQLTANIKALYDPVAPIEENQFTQRCTSAIDEAHKALQHHNFWPQLKDVLAKIVLTAFSFGLVPAALSAGSKLTTGSWQFTLFQSENSRELDNLSTATTRLLKP